MVMEKLCKVVAVLLVLCLQLRLGSSRSSYDGQQGTANRNEGLRSTARVIQAKQIRRNFAQLENRYRSVHFGSKAGWPTLANLDTPTSSASPFTQWPPWPWTPAQGQDSGGVPSSAPAPSPVAAEPPASPRQAEVNPPHSIALPPQRAATVATGAAPEAKRAGAGARHVYLIAAAGASVLLVAMSAVVLVLCYRSSKVVTVRPWATGLSGQLQKAFVTGVPALKRSELEIACEGFSNVIGSLPDYAMYKGTLSSGVEIAVVSTTKTSSKEWSKRCEAHFRKKITSLSRVNHKNFVNLLGFCEEELPFTRMMVFEYAPNGALFEHLHARDGGGHLDWPTRLRVAVGIAYCLEHMHQLKPPEILRTLDTATVYLTDDFAAKISDVFFCDDDKAAAAEAELASVSSPALADKESVVYSYGMVLLEIMAGRFTASEGGLVEGWAASFLRGERQLRDVMDPALRRSFHAETVDKLDGVVRSCADRDPRRRPAMAEVARRLREITAMPPDAATPKVSPLWWAELEIISTEAA